jgi:hypothetical protein
VFCAHQRGMYGFSVRLIKVCSFRCDVAHPMYHWQRFLAATAHLQPLLRSGVAHLVTTVSFAHENSGGLFIFLLLSELQV